MQYLIDLQGVQLSENEEVTWIQAMPLSSYNHPLYGKISFTADRIQRFAENIKNKVRGTDLDIDYDHKARRLDAAGWIADAEARLSEPDAQSNGLWLAIKWTSEARQKLADKAYRYFSPEYVDEWEHPQSGVKFKDVVFGGGLTNRPFQKNILPINLSEIDESEKEATSVANKVKESLGLPDTATDDEVAAAVEALKVVPAKDPAAPTSTTPVDADGAPQQLSDDIVKLAETNPAIAKLLNDQTMLITAVETLTQSNRLSEVTIALSDLDSGNKVLSPAAKDELKQFALAAPKELGDNMIALTKKILSEGIVELGELGGNTPDGSTANAYDSFDAKVKALSESAKISYTEAVTQVSLAEPELFLSANAEYISANKG